nr:hypothetical protein [Pseudoroseomonas cervicalis]
MGAARVFTGRPVLRAAAPGGVAGVLHAARRLGGEAPRDPGLPGVTSPAGIGAGRLPRPGPHPPWAREAATARSTICGAMPR